MARKAREKSDLGIYMVYLKSVDDIAFDAVDKTNFLDILVQNDTFLLSYTLLNNAFLFVLMEQGKTLDVILRTTTVKFVKRFNKAHNRDGKIFTGRYASSPANDMDEVWKLISNVHSVAKVNVNAVSSIDNYFENPYIKHGFVLNFFPTKDEFLKACSGELSDAPKIKMTDKEMADYIKRTFDIKPENLSLMPKSMVEKMVSQILSATKASVRQIARVSSLPLRMLWDLAKKLKPPKKETKKVNNEAETK